MTDDALPIVQYWHGEPKPVRIRTGLASFAELNPGVPHLVFDEAEAATFIEERLSTHEASAFRSCAVPAMQADYFRYCAVYALGGFYADADLRCVAPVLSLLEASEAALFARRELPGRVATATPYPYRVGRYWDLDNSPLAFRQPEHPLLEIAIEVATANIESRAVDGFIGVWLTAGQGVFTSMYLLDRLGSIDAFLAYAEDSVLAPLARLFCEVVGNRSRVTGAFDGVAIRPREDRCAWVEPLPRPQPGEQPPHWGEHEGSIYR